MMAPRYGNSNILVYISICSILGAFTVMSCKGLSLGIQEIFNQRPSCSYFYTFLFALIVVSCIIIQINYLNKSLDIFNTAVVTTVYYVLFTLCVMTASALLFKELKNLSAEDIVGCICGFTTIVCALCLIHFFKVDSNQNPKSDMKLKAFDNSDIKNRNLDEINNLSKLNDENNEKSNKINNKNDAFFSSLRQNEGKNDEDETRKTEDNLHLKETTKSHTKALFSQSTPVLLSETKINLKKIVNNENFDDDDDDIDDENNDENGTSNSNQKNYFFNFIKGNYKNLQKKYLKQFNSYKRVANENFNENGFIKNSNKIDTFKRLDYKSDQLVRKFTNQNKENDEDTLLPKVSFGNFGKTKNNTLLSAHNGTSDEEELAERKNFLSQTL